MIELRNCKRYFKDVKAVDDISLTITKNSVTIIEGESGAGKSTLLKLIGLMDLNYEGEYFINNINVKTLNNSQLSNFRNSFFGYIFQNYLLIEKENVYRNIEIPLLYSNKFKKKVFKEKIVEIAKTLHIDHLLYKKVNKLSGGERQRVAIARALVNEPEVILMDEPTSALNKELSEVLMKYIYNYIDSKQATLIIVTHDISRVVRYPFTNIIMKDGKIIQTK